MIFIVTTIVYSIWASGEVQPWNSPKLRTSPEYGNVENKTTTEKLLNENEKH